MNVYDFDGTIYDGDSTIDFFLYALRTKPSLARYIPKQVFGMILYALKIADKTKFKEKFFSFLKGIDAEALVDAFWEKHHNKVYSWYIKQKKDEDIIISASPEFLLKPVCDRLGVKHLIASEVDIRTGKFDGKNCRAEEKVRRLHDAFGEVKIDCFYSDSKSDSPLAKIAEKAFFIKKGRILPWED